MTLKLNAKQLRNVDELQVKKSLETIKRKQVYFILENIYDTYNIGGLFRLADALAIKKMYICGDSEIPPNPKIKKASIGTYRIVPWQYQKSVAEAVVEIRKNCADLMVVAVEQDRRAVSYIKTDYKLPLALVFSNETAGITKEALEIADKIVEIPMWGINRSLNVIVSAAIVSYQAIR